MATHVLVHGIAHGAWCTGITSGGPHGPRPRRSRDGPGRDHSPSCSSRGPLPASLLHVARGDVTASPVREVASGQEILRPAKLPQSTT
jgi:hypothetical protein